MKIEIILYLTDFVTANISYIFNNQIHENENDFLQIDIKTLKNSNCLNCFHNILK